MNELNKLRWRCRRGTLELDILLLNYLENHFPQANADTQQGFLRLLELEDTELMQYLLGEAVPKDTVLAGLTSMMRI
ncbi:succinate dehydrogenase assembly factor 2 [Methylomonas sp. AM2-LC]|uniref:FAD assembly factor SdhE n=1 Tax=Methylomonas sp. AM2-LC TaxID=3153301 RepID=UPI00326687EA